MRFICPMKKMAVFISAFLALTASGSALLREDFSGFKPSTRSPLSESVAVNDCPGVKYALEVRSIEEPGSKKIRNGSWASALFNSRSSETVSVEYQLKATKLTRYPLLVTDTQNRHLVSAVISDGKLQYCENNQKRTIGELPIDKWIRIRYDINIISGRYDVYIGDMGKTAATGISFPNTEYSIPYCLTLLSNPLGASSTFIADVTVTGHGVNWGIPASATAAPHHLYMANKTLQAPIPDGQGRSPCWQNAPRINLESHSGALKEEAYAKILWDDEFLYLFFNAAAEDIRLRANGNKERDGKIWLDDCYEIFIAPNKESSRYFHLVGNSVNGFYDAMHTDGKRDADYDSKAKVAVHQGEGYWSAEIVLPLASLGEKPGPGSVWRMNVCRENPFTKEIAAWRDLGFHNPDLFGRVIFADQKLQAMPAKTLMGKLAEELYNFSRRSRTLHQELAAINSAYEFREKRTSLTEAAGKCENSIADATHYLDIYQANIKLGKLEKEAEQLKANDRRLLTFFSPGTAGAKNSYVVSIEPASEKVTAENFGRCALKTAELTLAGRESGSIQVAALLKFGADPGNLKLKVGSFINGSGSTLPDTAVQTFQVMPVTTARPYKMQSNIPDALIPGTEFKLESANGVVTAWLEVQVPADTPPGKYTGKIDFTLGALAPWSVELAVYVLPFNLPAQSTLRNAFCFVPEWAEKYYGEKITKQQLRAYYDFILAHRLEPMNLWSGRDLSEDDLDYTVSRGKQMLFIQISRLRTQLNYHQGLVEKYEHRLKPYLFGHDEVMDQASMHPELVDHMKNDYKYAAEVMPHCARLNTAAIDERLFGYVQTWCPRFHSYVHSDAVKRRELGEEIWWYTTDAAPKGYPLFNLDSPGIDPRIIPWMNWKFQISGLLYWALNREWLTMAQEPLLISEKDKKSRSLDWLTMDVQAKIRQNMRWPDIPWIPFFRPNSPPDASGSITSGGGNLMYPGPNWQPYASTRLKNLRDGMQDYEYFVILNDNIEQLKKNNGDMGLIARAEKALAIDDNVVGGVTSYTKNPALLAQAKRELSDLIVQTQNALKK